MTDDTAADESSGEAKLEELDEHIRQARSRAEDNVEGVGDDRPSGPTASGGGPDGGDGERGEEFHDSGQAKSEDDQTIAPPG